MFTASSLLLALLTLTLPAQTPPQPFELPPASADPIDILLRADQLRLQPSPQAPAAARRALLQLLDQPLPPRLAARAHDLIAHTLATEQGWLAAQPHLQQAADLASQASSTEPHLPVLLGLSRADIASECERLGTAIQILRRLLADNPQLPADLSYQVHHRLGNSLHQLGQFQRASSAYEQAHALCPDPAQRPRIATALCLSLFEQGSFEETIARAARLSASAPGSEPQPTDGQLQLIRARAHAHLAREQQRLGQADSAQQHLSAAVAAGGLGIDQLTAEHGPDSPQLAAALSTHGHHLHQAGQLEAAEAALQRGLALIPPGTNEHRAVGRDLLENLWHLRLDQHRGDDARALAEQLTRSWLQWLEALPQLSSEADRLTFARQHHLVEAALGTLPPSALRSLGQPIPDSAATDSQRARIASALLAAQNLVLDSLLTRSPPPQPPSLADYQAALPANSALLLYTHHRAYQGQGQFRDRLFALLIGKQGPAQLLPLDSPRWVAEQARLLSPAAGSTQPTAPLGLLDWLRASFGKESSQQDRRAQASLAELDRLLWSPARSLLLSTACPSGCETLYLSLDGSLTTVPSSLWANGLPSSTSVTFLASPQALLRRSPSPAEPLAGPWLAVDAGSTHDLHFPASAPFPYDLATTDSPRLPGVATELAALLDKSPSQPWSRLQPVSEASLRQHLRASPPRLLHLAGHASASPADSTSPEETSPLWQGENEPAALWRSCFHFPQPRQASSRSDMDSDDWLFAAELAQLDLSHTALVTLSACSTGNGLSPSHEGNYSLARACHVAGARDVLSSTLPLRDQSTAAFMAAFYQALAQGSDPAQAAWQTQQRLLTEATRQHGLAKAISSLGFLRLLRSAAGISAAPKG